MTRKRSSAIVDVESAAQSVVKRLGAPLHERATVAALEAAGVRDVDAARIAPGCTDVFTLGRVVHARALQLAESAATVDAPPLRRPRPRGADEAGETVPPAGWRRVLRSYRYGIAYTIPLIATGIGLALLATSLWGSRALTSPQQTGMALAVVVSLVTAGPITHAMTRRLFHYWYTRDVAAVRRTGERWILAAAAYGAGTAAALGLAFTALGAWNALTITFVAALPFQPLLWASNSALFVIGRSWVGGAALMIPVPPLWLALQAGVPALPAHLGALAAANVLAGGATVVLLRRRARGWPAPGRPIPSRMLPMTVGGFAVWGVVYFLLVFTDRLVAWVGPQGIVFRPSYEAALQIALVPLVLVMPLLEYVLARTGEVVKDDQRRLGVHELPGLHRRIDRLMVRLIGATLGVYVVLAAGVWVVATTIPTRLPLRIGTHVATGSGRDVLLAALVAYACVVVGLGVATVFQLTARPWSLVTAGVAGVVMNVSVGVSARVHAGPDAAVAGLVAGAATFAAVTALIWLMGRRNLPHWWYAGA